MATSTGAGADETDDDLLLALAGIELAAATVHDAVLGTGLLDATSSAFVATFAEHHRAHALAYTEQLEADDPPEVDPAVLEALFTPVFGAADATSLLQGALAVEEAMGATAVDACARLADRDTAALVARVAAVEARHHAILEVALNRPPDAEPGTPALGGSLLDG